MKVSIDASKAIYACSYSLILHLLAYEITSPPTEEPTEEMTTEETGFTIPNKVLCENYMASDSGKMFCIFVLYGVLNNKNLNVVFNNIFTTKNTWRRLIMPPNAAPMDMKKSRRRKVVKRHVVC